MAAGAQAEGGRRFEAVTREVYRRPNPDDASARLLTMAVHRGLTSEEVEEVKKVARAISHLSGSGEMKATHTAEALQYRNLKGLHLTSEGMEFPWNRIEEARRIPDRTYKGELIETGGEQHPTAKRAREILRVLESSNPWPFSSRPGPAECTTRRSSLTIPQAVKAARKAGADIGDTGLFEDWLCRQGLQTRGDPIKARLQKAFNEGVEGGSAPTDVSQYKGVGIHHTDGEYATDLDPDSRFESVKEARAFIGEWKKMRTNPEHPNWVVEFVRPGPTGGYIQRSSEYVEAYSRQDAVDQVLGQGIVHPAYVHQIKARRMTPSGIARWERERHIYTRVGNPSPSGKEPWQMTRGEYMSYMEDRERQRLASVLGSVALLQRRPKKHRLSSLEREGKRTEWDAIVDNWRRRDVQAAVSRGDPVPPEVLADYTDLRSGNPKPTLKKLSAEVRHWGGKDAQRLPTELDTLGMVDRHFGPQVVRALTQKQINVLRDAAQEAFKARSQGNPARNGHHLTAVLIPQREVDGHSYRVAPIQGPTGPIQVEGAFPSRAQAERTVMAQVRDALRNVHGKYQVQFQGAS